MSPDRLRRSYPQVCQTPRQSSNRQVTSFVQRSVTSQMVSTPYGMQGTRVRQEEISRVVTFEDFPSNQNSTSFQSGRGLSQFTLPSLFGRGMDSRNNQVAVVPPPTPRYNYNTETALAQLNSVGTNRTRLTIPYMSSRSSVRGTIPQSTRGSQSNSVQQNNLANFRVPLSPRATPQALTSNRSRRTVEVKDKGVQTSPDLLFKFMAEVRKRSIF